MGRSLATIAVATALLGGCITFTPVPTDPTASASPAATATPTLAATPVATTPTASPTDPPPSPTPPTGLPPSGPPFPPRTSGQAVYDFAAVLSPEAKSQAADLIALIEEQTGAEIVVYTQYKPDADRAVTEADAAALIDDWAIGGPSRDGLVVFWNATTLKCQVGVPGDGLIQLSAASGFVERLTSEARKEIYDLDMLPWLRYCDEDNALLGGLEAMIELLGPAPTPTQTPPPGAATGACADPTYSLIGTYWPDGYEWYFDQGSVPDRYDKDEVLEVIKRAFDNIVNATNDCGLPDHVSATWHYRGTNSENACPSTTFRNVIGFGKLPRSSDILAQMCPYSAPGEVPSFAHILINSNVVWALSPESCSGRQWDLETTLTHEIGHVFGLGHVGERRHGDLTMSTIANGPCDTEELTLGLGDILGLEELYGSP